MKANVKKTIKFATGACAALGLVAVGAVVASGTAVKVVAEGFKAAKDAMQQTMKEIRAETDVKITAEESGAAFVPETAAVEVTPADFEELPETSEI